MNVLQESFFYEIAHTAAGATRAQQVGALIQANPDLAAIARPWPGPGRPRQATLYALLVVVTDDVRHDAAIAGQVRHAESGGFPLVPVVDDVKGYDFRAAPLQAIQERNAVGLNDPEGLVRSLSHHAGLTPYEGGGHVFISYGRADGTDLAHAIRDALHAARIGQTVDAFAFAGGDRIQDDINARIDAADVVVLVDSPAAAASGWVAQEIDRALAARAEVVAVSPPGASFRYALGVPHVADGDVDGVVSHVRRLIARQTALHDRVHRTLVRLGRLRQWNVETVAPHWLVRTPARLRVGYTPAPADAEEVLLFAEAAAPDPGVFVIGARPLEPTSRRALGRVAGPDVRLTPLPTLASYVGAASGGAQLTGARVLLSAAMPSEAEEIQLANVTLAPFVVALVQALAALGATLVFGGHPSITPLVHEARGQAGHGGAVELFQARSWQGAKATLSQQILDGPLFKRVSWHGQGTNPTDDLAAMRDAMITPTLDAAVFVGGKTTGFIGDRPGIHDEHDRFVAACPGKPAFLLHLAGGAARTLPPDESQVGLLLQDLTDPDLAVALIVAELLTRRKGSAPA